MYIYKLYVLYNIELCLYILLILKYHVMSCLCHVWCLPGTAQGDGGAKRRVVGRHPGAPNQKHDPYLVKAKAMDIYISQCICLGQQGS